ncbi:hypothetical protein DSL72_001305 [Monilinia vaccinii-corymbosi]|uniref:Major facilitator superfamily (MFS) profile domain-containing protein n=1 Tax=Monilinia vaccinii-corymbosi TaxID=61207 RepID=A0A8A3PAK2_9HELO|nr:hypothetical protein DSL72_001305 [Monilinia vaccinii-corymbosi]
MTKMPFHPRNSLPRKLPHAHHHHHHHDEPIPETAHPSATTTTPPVELPLWEAAISCENSGEIKDLPRVDVQARDSGSGKVTDVDVDIDVGADAEGDGVGREGREEMRVRGVSDAETEMVTGTEAHDPERVYQQLLPVDGGRAAWRVLIAAFIFEAILWGFPISFGVFQDYYFTLPQFSPAKSQIALVGTISQGLCYLGAPLSASLTKRFPRYQTHQIWLGLPLCILSLVAGSFCTSVHGLIWTQGVMYGCGFLTLTYPIISMLNEWWIVRKGMAFGLISAASGVSGAGMPFLIQFLLSRYGYQTALRIIAIGITIFTVPLLPLLRGRLPPSERSSLARTNWAFVKTKLFWVYGASTLVYGMGFFYPGVYLPSYATSVGLSGTQGAAVLAVMSVAQVGGQFASFFGECASGGVRIDGDGFVVGAVGVSEEYGAVGGVWGGVWVFWVWVQHDARGDGEDGVQ